MNYCSHCGKKPDYRIPEGDTHYRFVCSHCGTIHYQNPRMIVGCLPIWKGNILLCKRAIDPQFGKWTIPAGFLENGETAEQGALRETEEEAGARVKIDKLHALYSIPQVNQVYAIYLATMTNDQLNPGEETQKCRFYTINEIPWDKIAFTAVTFCLEKYIENLSNNSPGTFLGSLDIKKPV